MTSQQGVFAMVSVQFYLFASSLLTLELNLGLSWRNGFLGACDLVPAHSEFDSNFILEMVKGSIVFRKMHAFDF